MTDGDRKEVEAIARKFFCFWWILVPCLVIWWLHGDVELIRLGIKAWVLR